MGCSVVALKRKRRRERVPAAFLGYWTSDSETPAKPALLAALGRWCRRGRRRWRWRWRARRRSLDYRSVGAGLRCRRRRGKRRSWRRQWRRIAAERRLCANPEGPAIVVIGPWDRGVADEV